jgi:hypothetical protein
LTRLHALARLNDADEILNVALKSEHTDVAVSALERIETWTRCRRSRSAAATRWRRAAREPSFARSKTRRSLRLTRRS